MTINGFWKVLNETHSIGQRRLSISQWIKNFHSENDRFPRIGVDFYQFLFEALPVDSAFPVTIPGIRSVMNILLNKIYTLIGLNISFVLVFDGKLSRGKLRNEGKIPRDVSFDTQYQMEHKALANDDHFVTHPLIIELKKLFDILNIKYITAPNDGEIELARLNASGEIDAIISNDADFFLYGGVCMLRNFSKSEKDLPSSSADSSQSRYFVTPITMKFLESIGINQESMYFIALTAGDDYSGGWTGVGIYKAIAMADMKLPFAKTLSEIYVNPNTKEYIQGIPRYNVNERIERMNILISDINKEIVNNSRAIFGRLWNCTIPDCTETPEQMDGPNDFNNMIHFYPLCANILFKFQPFCLNSGPLKNVTNRLPVIPQLGSIIKNDQIFIRRGTERDVLMGHTNFETGEFIVGKELNMYTIDDWFKPIFKLLKPLHKPNTTNPDALLLSKLTRSFIFRIIMYMDLLKLDHDDIIITQSKSKGETFARRTFDDEMYRVTYKPEKCMGDLLDIHLVDDDGISLKDQVEHEWIPKYILETHMNGVFLINRYETMIDAKTSKKSTPRSKRGTPKHSPQKTNLFMLTKSPFKVIGRSKSDLGCNSATNIIPKSSILDFKESTIANTNSLGKRYKDTPLGGSPTKKSKLAISREESISDVSKRNQPLPSKDLSVTNFDTFEEDDEVSRILGDDSYIGEVPDNNDIEKNEDDLLFEKKLTAVHINKEIVVLDDSFSDGSFIPVANKTYIEEKSTLSDKQDVDGSDASWERGFSNFLSNAKYVDDSGIILNSDSDVETINIKDMIKTPTKVLKPLRGSNGEIIVSKNDFDANVEEPERETGNFNVSVSSEENLMSMFD